MFGVMKMKTDIIFIDESISVCLKPAGLDSQEDMCALLREETGGEIFCVHRLDKEVGGLMVYARSSGATAFAIRRVSMASV